MKCQEIVHYGENIKDLTRKTYKEFPTNLSNILDLSEKPEGIVISFYCFSLLTNI